MERAYAVVLAAVIALASATSAPWWWRKVFGSETTPASGITRFVGGYEPFRVHAQNRWEPMGTALRAAPDVASHQEGGFPPNKIIFVDGWVRARVAYPTNPPP